MLTARLRILGEYVLALALCLGLLVWYYSLLARDLSVPLDDGGDVYYHQLLARLVLERGTALEHPDLGAPHGLTLYDFQSGNWVQIGMFRLLGFFTRDPFQLTTFYYLLTFPLAALFSLAVFRALGVRFGPALLACLLYAFLPYHHLRCVAHLFLSGYYLIPLAVLLVIWVIQEQALFQGRWPTRRGWLAVLFALILGNVEIYYAFFTCFFLVVAGLIAGLRQRRLMASSQVALLVVLVSASTLTGLLPKMIYTQMHGANQEGLVRTSSDAQYFDLRLSQVLMPVSGHRFPLLAKGKREFNARLAHVTENDMASLGLLGSIGLLYLLTLVLVPVRPQESESGSSPAEPAEPPLRTLCLLTISGILLTTMGGFGFLIAGVFPFIRCYNRIIVFLAFFALVALAVLVQRLLDRMPGTWRGNLARAGILTALLLFGIWDQTPTRTSVIPPAEPFLQARAFVRAIEAAQAETQTVFQFPYMDFPEGRGYEHLALSLQAQGSRWSYPAMKGRYPDLWQRKTGKLPPRSFLERLAWAGFTGVCCDRRVLDAGERASEAEFARVLGKPLLVSPDQRYAFYSLMAYREKLRARVDTKTAERLREDALYPVVVSWGSGFQQPLNPDRDGRWANTRAELILHNPSSSKRTVHLDMHLASSPAGPGQFVIEGPGIAETHEVTTSARACSLRVEIPPGQTVLHFRSQAPCHPDHPRRHVHVTRFAMRSDTDPAGLAQER